MLRGITENDCIGARKRVSQQLDGELSELGAARLRAHLRVCPACAEFAATTRAATAALRQAVYLRDALLPSAREAYRVASVSYGLGGSSALDVLDARRNLLDAELQYADALAAANTSRADLERAVAAPLSSFDITPRRAP